MLFIGLRSYRSSQHTFMFFASLLSVFMLISLVVTSCAGSMPGMRSTARPTTAPLPGLLNAHVLTVGSYTNYLPQEFVDPLTHTITGFDINLIQAMAQHMHLKLTIINGDFQTLIPDLIAKRFDIVISAVSITTDLQKKVDFIPYFNGGESLLVPKGNPLHIQTLEDLCGQSVAVKDGSFEQSDLAAASDLCQKNGKLPISITVNVQYTELMQLLSAKTVVAVYLDAPLTDYAIKQSPQLFTVGGSVMEANLEGIVVRKDDLPMLHALEAAFNAIKADGTYHTIVMRWGLTSGDITTAVKHPA